MYDGAILLTFCIFAFFGSAYLTGVIENLIKRNKARKRYYRELEKENVRLNKVIDFLRLELDKKYSKQK